MVAISSFDFHPAHSHRPFGLSLRTKPRGRRDEVNAWSHRLVAPRTELRAIEKVKRAFDYLLRGCPTLSLPPS